VDPPTASELAAIKDEEEREEARKSAGVSKSIGTSLKYVRQAFCELPLNPPKDVAGSGDLNCTDPWIFPLEIGILERRSSPKGKAAVLYYFRRPYGEKGEVPDWYFRAKYFEKKGYILANKAINPKKDDDEDTKGDDKRSSRSSKSQ
jgi:hypothetical protein